MSDTLRDLGAAPAASITPPGCGLRTLFLPPLGLGIISAYGDSMDHFWPRRRRPPPVAAEQEVEPTETALSGSMVDKCEVGKT